MSDPTPAPGWYPAPHANNEPRYWDGTRWLEPQSPPAEDAALSPEHRPTAAPEASAGRSPVLAILALIVGIIAFLSGIVPIVGAILGAAAVTLGILGLIRKQPKGLTITGIVLGSLAVVTSIAVTAGITANLPTTAEKPRPAATAESSSAPEQSESSPSPTPTPTPTPTPSPEATETVSPPASATPDLSTFYPTDERSWALVAKDPDSYSGTNVILYGSIMQFDSATGRCAMIISTAATQQEYSFDYEQNVMAVSGDWDSTCPVFDPLVEDDNVKIWATIDQSFSYDTQIGGNTTVPLVEVWYVELLPATEY